MTEDKRTIPDYVSVTFPLVVSMSEDEQERSIQTYRVTRDFFGLKDCQCRSEAYASNNFKYQYTLSEFITLRCDGPVNSDGERTCQLEMKGEGCREFERLAQIRGITWLDLFNFLIGMNATFKRFDLANDDKSGLEMNQNYFYKKLKKGEYTSVFKSPAKFYGFDENTFNIELGGRRSSTQLVVYDKRLEQLQKHNQCDESYWTRYELRFRGAKADAMVLELCKNYRNPDDLVNGLDLNKFARTQLLNTLDIKDSNGFNDAHKCLAPTDPKWLAFLDNIEKGEPVKVEQRETNYESRRAYAMPKAAGVIATWFMMKNKDMDLFMHDFFKEMYALLTKFTDKQKKRLNENLLENGIEPLSEEGFDNLRLAFYEKALDMELPF
jgi:hypothetical protein